MLAIALTGWYLGFALATLVIAIVVILVASILVLARRIATQALAIEVALDDGRVNTLGLWDVSRINDTLYEIVGKAETARSVVEGL